MKSVTQMANFSFNFPHVPVSLLLPLAKLVLLIKRMLTFLKTNFLLTIVYIILVYIFIIYL